MVYRHRIDAHDDVEYGIRLSVIIERVCSAPRTVICGLRYGRVTSR